jgi:hypothetical protein
VVDVLAEIKQCWKMSVIGLKIYLYYLELLYALEGTLSCWSRLHLQLLASTDPHWARVVGYGTFF